MAKKMIVGILIQFQLQQDPASSTPPTPTPQRKQHDKK